MVADPVALAHGSLSGMSFLLWILIGLTLVASRHAPDQFFRLARFDLHQLGTVCRLYVELLPSQSPFFSVFGIHFVGI